MKVLYVDQFSKTEGEDTIQLIERMNLLEQDITIDAFFADDTYLIDKETIKTKIEYGFVNVFKGNIIKKIINYLKGLRNLKKYAKRNGVDIIHLQWFSIPWLEYYFVKRLRKKYKIVVTIHDVIPFNNRKGEIKALKKIYSQAHLLLVHSEYAKEEIQRIYNPKSPINVVTKAFCDKDKYEIIDKKIARKKLGIPENSFVVMNYGTIRDSKGVDILIKATEEAQKENNNIFLLVGGCLKDVDIEWHVKKKEEFESSNRGLLTFDFVPKEEEQYYFSAADVLCLPYKSGWQSGVVQLGLVYALPMIVSNIRCFEDCVIDGFNGFVFNGSDVDDLKKKIVSLANDANKIKNFSDNSASLYEKEFTLEKKAQEIITQYKNLI